MLLVPEYKHTHTHHCVSSLHDINTSQKHNCIEVEVSVYLQLIIKIMWMMIEWCMENMHIQIQRQIHHIILQPHAPCMHLTNSHRLESIAELLEFAARLSKISGKFKLRSCGNLCSGAMFRLILPNDLEKSKLWISTKKAAASYTSQCQPRFTSAAYASSEWSTWKYPNAEQICIQRKTVLASTLVLKPKIILPFFTMKICLHKLLFM